jgi:glycosyltransferase involved in cell wall biosynthesis
MTILHLITRLILGGAQQNTVITCAAQVKAGHAVTLAYGPIYGPEGSLLDEAKASGATLVEVPTLRRAVLPWHDLRCYRELRALIRRVTPDVVHTHSSKAGILGRAAAWAEGVPCVVHTIHGLPFHDRQWWPVRTAYIAAERWAARRCHKLIGITQAMCDEFAANGIGRDEQFTVICSGVDIEHFTEDQGAAGQVLRAMTGIGAAPVVGLVGRFDPMKGHADLLDVAPMLIQRVPDVRFLFVGDGWGRRQVESRIAHQGLGDRVTIGARVKPTLIRRWYDVMDVVALPSYQEGQGRVLVEAMLCGCAVVAYDTGGIRDVVIDNVTGRLVPRGNRAALGEAVARLLEHPEHRKRLAEQGREHALKHFDARDMVEKIERVYRDVLDETRRHGDEKMTNDETRMTKE